MKILTISCCSDQLFKSKVNINRFTARSKTIQEKIAQLKQVAQKAKDMGNYGLANQAMAKLDELLTQEMTSSVGTETSSAELPEVKL